MSKLLMSPRMPWSDRKSSASNIQHGLSTRVAKVPIFCVTIKLHQEAVGLRFVASSPSVPLTLVLKWLSFNLNTIMPRVSEHCARAVVGILGPMHRNWNWKSWIPNDFKEAKMLLDRCYASRVQETIRLCRISDLWKSIIYIQEYTIRMHLFYSPSCCEPTCLETLGNASHAELTHQYPTTVETHDVFVSHGLAQISRLIKWGWGDTFTLDPTKCVFAWYTS